MAWVSPKVYAILSKSEEGKDIIERLPDLTQDECQEELDAFFGEGGKGASSSDDYGQAKIDDEAEEEERYKAIGDEEVSEKDYEDDQAKREEEAKKAVDKEKQKEVFEKDYEEEYKVGDKVKVFNPTKKTIWDDIEHPLYGIAPSEQNENYLSDAIQEMQKYSRNWNTMSKKDKNNVSPEGKKYLEMKLNRYKKALEYIKKGGE